LTQTLIVSGCSIAHGCETYNGFMHDKNIENSFGQHLANRLECDLANVALSGGSNDHVFFSTMQEIEKRNNIHSIIVSWTSLNRLSWTHGNRHWMFSANWATSIEKFSSGFADWKRNIQHNHCWYNSDIPEHIETLKTQHSFFLDNYLDDDATLVQKLKCYSKSLNAVCQQLGLRLIEITPFDLADAIPAYRYAQDQPWMDQGRHPTVQEHILIADELFNKYYTKK
jgi:hypothetical protein